MGQLRRAARLSQADLADKLTRAGFPMKQQTILTIERGSRPLKLEEAHVIAEVLGVDPRSLVETAAERIAALAELRAAEEEIARCDREIARLVQEIQRNDQLRHKAAERLVALFKAEGRPDLVSIYADPEPVENLITEWRKTPNG